jgi:hypothetical protein|tara:strand:- start:6070 stop:6840 length:771 start_codon:yes stop_codon:yes gene_type:complete
MDKGIDFVVVNFYRSEYVYLLVRSIHKYTKDPYTIYIMNNGINEGEDNNYDELKALFDDDDKVVVLKGVEQEQEIKPEDTNSVECKIGGRMISIASKTKTESQRKGIRSGNREFVCLLDYDAIFLNEWVDDVLPMLEDYTFIGERWEPPLGTVKDQILLIKRKTLELYNLYPNTDYQDGSGNLTYFCHRQKLSFTYFENSFNNRDLRKLHLLNIGNGEQCFVNGKPFYYHYARGATRDKSLYHQWITAASNYLGGD